MMAIELENRLRVIDLRLPEVGDHLVEERIALIGGGLDPTAAEATHLAGCDECTELLAVLGEALEVLAVEAPELVERVLPPPLPAEAPRRRPWLWLAGGLLAAAAAAAAVNLRPWSAPLGPAIEAGTGFEIPQPPRPAAVKPAAVRSTAEPLVARIEVARPANVEAIQTLPPAPAPRLHAAAEPGKEGQSSEVQSEPRTPRAPSSGAPEDPRLDVEAPGPDPALNARGPVAVERLAIDGPPRGFGTLQLMSTPAAMVYINGKRLDWTPIIGLRLPEGHHDVRLVYDSPLAREPERRMRVRVLADKTWHANVKNVRP